MTKLTPPEIPLVRSPDRLLTAAIAGSTAVVVCGTVAQLAQYAFDLQIVALDSADDSGVFGAVGEVAAVSAAAASWLVLIRVQPRSPITVALPPMLTFIALDKVFRLHAVDPERIAVAGFSDGASYALSIGLINGALFKDILAFSPGFMAPTGQSDLPRVFISHGIHDEVLPIDPCSRRIVSRLKRAGYDVEYQEFDGGHVVPPGMVERAVARFLV